MTDALDHLGLTGHDIAGLLGFLTYLGAFASVQFGLLDGNSTTYSLANIVAAALVAVSLAANFNLASALIQGSWIMIGLAGLGLRAWKAWPSTRRVLAATLDDDRSARPHAVTNLKEIQR